MNITYELWQRRMADIVPVWGPYEVTYTGEVPFTNDHVGTILEDLFRIFNIAHPADFRSHSLSVGDRVVLGECTFECKPFGWEPAEHPTEAPETVNRYMF